MKNTIKKQWKSYLEKVVPEDAGPNQVSETKKSFYAGAVVLYEMMVEDIPAMSEADGIAMMQELGAEIDQALTEMMSH